MRACRALTRFAGVRHAAGASSAAAAAGIPSAAMTKANAPYLVWTELNVVARQRLEKLTATENGKTNYGGLRTGAKAPSSQQPLKKAFESSKTLQDLAKNVEATLQKVRELEQERAALQLEVWSLNDQINLGLNVHTADKIEQFKKQIVTAKAQLAENRKKHTDYCAKHFDTQTFNEVINAFRIAGERHHNAREYAEMLLDDMSLADVKFDDATKILLKNVVFNDMPHEDSNLLFTFVENPERGEVSLAPIKDGDLTAVADEAVITIGHRHTTPVTEHTKLQQKDTHPMLQRSPE